MFVRKTHTTINGKQYTNHLLVESVRTPKGPRQRTVCSLGSLKARTAKEWLKLAARLQDALGGQEDLFADAHDPEIQMLREAAHKRRSRSGASKIPPSRTGTDIVEVDTERIEIENPREAGPVYVGSTMYDRVGIDDILTQRGLTRRTCLLIRLMVLNRLVFPGSEHAMPHWTNRAAVGDILDVDFSKLTHTSLYRGMDRLYEQRDGIEHALRQRECDLFGLEDTIFFYDLTSHYFEGECLINPQAKRGYSRDKRPDCKQVVVGLVVDKEGLPIAHEVFDGNRRDSTTVEAMLDALSKRSGTLRDATVVVDRGMAFDTNLASIRARGSHYIVAARQAERDQWLAQVEEECGFVEIKRTPSPRNPYQKKSIVEVKRIDAGDGDSLVLCRSEGRIEKDRAIRLRAEKKWMDDTAKLARRIDSGTLVDRDKIHEAIGRLKERYPRVARYYSVVYEHETRTLTLTERADRKRKAALLDGTYILKTDRHDLSDEQIWRTYILLTRAENAFRSMKSPLCERPIFHHLERRVQTHIFLCVLAYHLLALIEKHFLDSGEHTSWQTIRQTLSTHQTMTVVLPCGNGRTLRIRRATKAEESHRQIYQVLGISPDIIKPKKTWCRNESENDGVVTE
jgi:transposase